MNITSLEINGNKLNTGKSVLVESYTDPNTHQWYRVYSDGWCEQGGQVVPNGTNHDVTVTFLKPFVNTDYYFSKTNNNDYNSVYMAKYGNNVLSYSTQSVTIGVANYEIGNDHWIAKGYINLEDNSNE